MQPQHIDHTWPGCGNEQVNTMRLSRTYLHKLLACQFQSCSLRWTMAGLRWCDMIHKHAVSKKLLLSVGMEKHQASSVFFEVMDHFKETMFLLREKARMVYRWSEGVLLIVNNWWKCFSTHPSMIVSRLTLAHSGGGLLFKCCESSHQMKGYETATWFAFLSV